MSCVMSTLTHDTASGATPDGADVAASRLTAGLLFALVSAVSFGLSGALARGLHRDRLERRGDRSWSGSGWRRWP